MSRKSDRSDHTSYDRAIVQMNEHYTSYNAHFFLIRTNEHYNIVTGNRTSKPMAIDPTLLKRLLFSIARYS